MKANEAIQKLHNQMTSTLTIITELENKKKRPLGHSDALKEYKRRYEAFKFAIQAIKTIQIMNGKDG